MSKDKILIFPSRANFVLMKLRFMAAVKGLGLLKRKRDVIELKLKEFLKEQQEIEDDIPDVMKKAYFTLIKANFLQADLKTTSIVTSERADVFLRIVQRKMLGIKLPFFDLIMWRSTSNPLVGLSRGGEQVEIVRERFQNAIKMLIKLASLRYTVKVLKDTVRRNNMRINGLEYLMIPKINNTVHYIAEELDEYEREEFYRLKCSQRKQAHAKAKFLELIKSKNEEKMLREYENRKIYNPIMNLKPDELFNQSNFNLGPSPSKKTVDLKNVETTEDPTKNLTDDLAENVEEEETDNQN